MDDGIGIRPLRETDAEAVVALYARAANVEPRLGPITLAQWQRFTKLPQNHGGRDFRIAEQDGHPVGVAESSLRIQGDIPSRFIKIVVAPEIRRQRIGLRLFDELLAIDGQRSPKIFDPANERLGHVGRGDLAAVHERHVAALFGDNDDQGITSLRQSHRGSVARSVALGNVPTLRERQERADSGDVIALDECRTVMDG